MVVGAGRAADVVGLLHGGVLQELVFLEVVADQGRLVEIETVLAVTALAPSTAEDEAAGACGVLLAVETSVLRAAEADAGAGAGFGGWVKAFVMVGAWAA